MRHEVNQAASAKVHSSGRAFEQFKEAINDEDFEDLLKDAQADPNGVAAQDLLKKVLPFLRSSNREKEGGERETTQAIGQQRASWLFHLAVFRAWSWGTLRGEERPNEGDGRRAGGGHSVHGFPLPRGARQPLGGPLGACAMPAPKTSSTSPFPSSPR